MANKIQFRRDTSSNWASANTLLSEGELGFEIDTGFAKIGDGIKTWDQLGYLIGSSGDIQSLLLSLGDGSSTTPNDKLRIYAQKLSGRTLPKFKDQLGATSFVQPYMGRNDVGYWKPQGNSNVVPAVMGFGAYTTVGTATARNVAITNFFNRLRRIGYVSAATAGSLVSLRQSTAQILLGDGTFGGFHKVIRFGISDAVLVTGARSFIGISSNVGAPTNVNPSTLTNSIGIGNNDTDTNFKLYFGGSVPQPPIDLGVNFPCNTTNVDAYELSLFSDTREDRKLYWEVTRINTGHVAKGVIDGSIDNGVTLPATNTILSYSYMYRTNNATALAVGLDIISDYIESVY